MQRALCVLDISALQARSVDAYLCIAVQGNLLWGDSEHYSSALASPALATVAAPAHPLFTPQGSGPPEEGGRLLYKWTE